MAETIPENQEEHKHKFNITDKRHWAEGEISETGASENKLPTYVEQLKNEAEEKDKRLREYIAAYKTKNAEMEEFRTRLQKENEARLDQYKATFFAKLLPILDNLKRASAAQSSSDFESLKQGIQIIINQFNREFEDAEVKPIPAKGRKFNPATDEACMTVETKDPTQDNMVIEELEPGYTFREKLIKAVKVKVAKLS